MKEFGGKAYFIDRDNINTDEIIPAKYLTYIEKEPLKPFLLEDLKMEGFDASKVNWDDIKVIISRSNFGSGSSREMAVWVFEINGINVLLASNFARIFLENCFNNGVLAIERGEEKIEEIFSTFSMEPDVNVSVDLENKNITISSGEKRMELDFSIGKFQKDLVAAGGWVQLANDKY